MGSRSGNALDCLWEDACLALERCDQLIIIGYSFPLTDVRAWQLIEEAMKKRVSKLAMTLIDPFPTQLQQRLNQKFGNQISLKIVERTFDQATESDLN